MKVSEYLAEHLHQQGVRRVYQVVGGMITHLVDAMHRLGRPQLVSVHHEQAAAFAADAEGRLTGVPGAAMATSGPGAVNLLTGIGSCFFDSSPAVFITGQVNRHELKGDRKVRQLGFQETDIVSMAAPVTKAAFRVHSPEEVPVLLDKAFETALSGRPGPVLLDIPMDVQRMEVSGKAPSKLRLPDPAKPSEKSVRDILDVLAGAERPLILAGGGIRSAGAGGLLRRFARAVGTPVANSLMAVDALAHDDPLRVGMIGSYGNRWANLAVGKSDFLLVLGSRLDIRQTGSEASFLTKGRTVFHVDCDPAEINNRVTGCRGTLAHLAAFLEEALSAVKGRSFPGRDRWLAEIRGLREQWPDDQEVGKISGINPNVLMRQISESSVQAAVYVADVGQHQMWAGQSLRLRDEQSFITSGGMGAMGFSLPAAIGASFCRPEKPVVLIAGDGGFQLNIQDLQTIVRNKLPIKMVILNNNCHGMVRQFQESYFGSRYPATFWGYSAPDFSRVAGAYGIEAATVEDPSGTQAALAGMWADPLAPYLLQVKVDTNVNVFPKIAFGLPMTEMEPHAKPLEMEGT